ncbi:uncharacterized protein [Miscanthus floridulus]|uniref:uncharacterized protein n=1 Tax=Miscanthus floridulus TaxID=154761 RepID=UPI003457CEBB
MSGSQFKGGAAACSSSAAIQSPALFPLVDCPKCRIQLVRITSKQRETYGKTFVKCPNNIKDDSTTCPIIMSEAQYEAYLRNPEQHPIRSKKVIPFNSVDGGHGSMDLNLDLKQDLEVVKAKLDSVVIDLWELKVQVQVVKKDYVIIAAVCVGVAIGCLMSKIWK